MVDPVHKPLCAPSFYSKSSFDFLNLYFLFQIRNIFKKISARIRQGTGSREEPSTEDTEALEDEMDEFNDAVEESEDVDEMTNQINSSSSREVQDDEDDHPIMVCNLKFFRFKNPFCFACCA